VRVRSKRDAEDLLSDDHHTSLEPSPPAPLPGGEGSHFAISSCSTRPSEQVFLATATLLFAASAVTTVVGCADMSAMGEMPMPGGWNMSMAWMRMPGQSWSGAAAAFLGMWTVMMMAMMLPSLVPMLGRYRRALMETSRLRVNGLTALVGLAYFSIWSAFGALLFPLGAMLAALAMEHPAVAHAAPTAAGIIMLIAGVMQFTAWKARHLACCRELPRRGCAMRTDAATAWRHGLRLSVHCGCSSAGLTAMLLVGGVMNLTAMTAVTIAIVVERMAPGGERIARGIGIIMIGVGVSLLLP
jgi:predicted metal-binding membrane protein